MGLPESFLNAVTAAKGEGLESPVVFSFTYTWVAACTARVPLCVGVRNKIPHFVSVFV